MELAQFSLGKIWVTSYIDLPLRITCCRVSPWKEYINFYISLMVIGSLDAVKKFSKKKETGIKKEIVGVLQQPSNPRKILERKAKDQNGEILGWPCICWLD